jgi:hypothetical protein
MKQSKLDPESIKWIEENPKEFTEELIRKLELVKKFSDKLEPYRKNKDRIGYDKLFKELLKKEEEKQWKKE